MPLAGELGTADRMVLDSMLTLAITSVLAQVAQMRLGC